MTDSKPRAPRPLQPHGTTARARGREWAGIPPCLCTPCVTAMRRSQNRNTKLRGLGRPGFVLAATAVRHMNLLIEAGMTWDELRQATGFGHGTIMNLRRPDAEDRTILASTQARILAVPVPPRAERAPGGWSVDGTGTIRRRRALAYAGWPGSALSDRSGFGERQLRDLLYRERVTVGTRSRIAALYNALADTPGPSGWAAAHARRQGWHGPAAWEGLDIDDPAVSPGAAAEVRLGRPVEVAEEVAFLRSTSAVSDEQAARYLGMSVETLQMNLKRAQVRHPELVAA